MIRLLKEDAQQIFDQFYDERIDNYEIGSITVGQLEDVFKDWSRDNENNILFTPQQFRKFLRSKGVQTNRIAGRERHIGIRLRENQSLEEVALEIVKNQLLKESKNSAVLDVMAALSIHDQADNINKLVNIGNQKSTERLIALLGKIVVEIADAEGINIGELDSFITDLIRQIWEFGGV